MSAKKKVAKGVPHCYQRMGALLTEAEKRLGKQEKELTRLRADSEALDLLDEAFSMHYGASLFRQGPYMNGKNVGFSTSQFGPRVRESFRSVREVAQFLKSKKLNDNADDA